MKHKMLLALHFCLSVPLIYALGAAFKDSLPLLIQEWSTPSIVLEVMRISGTPQKVLPVAALFVVISAVAVVLSLKARTFKDDIAATLIALVVSMLLLAGLFARAHMSSSVLGLLSGEGSRADFVVSLMTDFHCVVTYPITFGIWLICRVLFKQTRRNAE